MAQESTTAKRPDRMEAIGSWILLVAILCENLGVVWDVQWHDDVGPDTFFTASHLLIYLAPVIAGLTSLYIVLRRTADRRRGTEDSESAAAAVTVLGTDGYGRSDSRAQLRRHFEVDAPHVVVASLRALADEGKLDMATVKAAIKKFNIDPDKPNPVTQ